MNPQHRYAIGLDLGQAQDFTALAVVERPPYEPKTKPVFSLRHLQRFPLGTAYTAIVPAVCKLASEPQLKGAPLVVDYTGVGRALVDMFQRASKNRIVPVSVTSGHTTTKAADGSYHVPKKELVTCLQLILQARRLKVARSLPESDTLVEELQNFRVKITAAANETFGAWRNGQHDDLVFAVVLACWWLEKSSGIGPEGISCSQHSIVSSMPPGVFNS